LFKERERESVRLINNEREREQILFSRVERERVQFSSELSEHVIRITVTRRNISSCSDHPITRFVINEHCTPQVSQV